MQCLSERDSGPAAASEKAKGGRPGISSQGPGVGLMLVGTSEPLPIPELQLNSSSPPPTPRALSPGSRLR